jgi:transcriptional regulator with XRE-family HTH domain
MSFGQKLKLLRKEKDWSQDQLAYHAQIDGRQISRYENDRVVPSVEVIVKVATTFDVSIDYLLLEKAPRRPLQAPQSKLIQKIIEIGTLSAEDERSLLHLLEAIEAKNKLKQIIANVG